MVIRYKLNCRNLNAVAQAHTTTTSLGQHLKYSALQLGPEAFETNLNFIEKQCSCVAKRCEMAREQNAIKISTATTLGCTLSHVNEVIG